MITKSEVLANRIKWIEFLEVPSRRKTTGYLDDGGGKRCCLGHACYVLGIKGVKGDNYGEPSQKVWYANENAEAPQELVEMVGLWDTVGSSEIGNALEINREFFSSLATANDGDDGKALSPQTIGAYLRTVVEGGSDTPFRPLTEYGE